MNTVQSIIGSQSLLHVHIYNTRDEMSERDVVYHVYTRCHKIRRRKKKGKEKKEHGKDYEKEKCRVVFTKNME